MIQQKDLPNPLPHNGYPFRWTRNIWLLGVREFPSFLVVGNKACAIIEAGVSAVVPKVISDMKALNLTVPLKYLIASHAHADHVAGLIKLKQLLPELSLIGSETTANILGKKNIVRNFIREDLMYAKYLSNSGVIDNPPEKLPETPVKVDMVMDCQQPLDLGDLQLHFLDAPGHAPGNTVIHIKPENAFLISDSAGYAKGKNDILPLFFHHYTLYLNTLNTILNAKPRHIGLGHNLTISGENECQGFLRQATGIAQKIKKKIIRDLNNNLPSEKIEQQLADKMLCYGLFQSFSRETLTDLSKLIIRRATEA